MGWKVDSIPFEDQLFITLMKLRGNYSNLDLATRNSVSDTTISNLVLTWMNVLHEILSKGLLCAQGIPSLCKYRISLPTCFSSFTSWWIVLDCTEVQCEIPSDMEKQSQTFSHYKQRNTLKGLVGVAHNGVITFVSSLNQGSMSEKIARHCNVLEAMEPGDLIVADKDFLIQDIMPAGVSLNLPPFLTQGQFTREQAELTVTIALARIHVERAIHRMCFSILYFIPHTFRPVSSKIFQVIGSCKLSKSRVEGSGKL